MIFDGDTDVSKHSTMYSSTCAREASFVSLSEQARSVNVAVPRGINPDDEVDRSDTDATASASDAGAVQREEMQCALAAFINISALTERHISTVFASGLWEVLLNMLLREAARNEQHFTILVLWAVVEMLPHANANPPNITKFCTQLFDALCLLLARQRLNYADLKGTSNVGAMPMKQGYSLSAQQCERWWASVDFGSGGWLQQSGLHTCSAGHGSSADFINLLWKLSSKQAVEQPCVTDGVASAAEHTGYNSDMRMKLKALDALSAMQMWRLLVELFLYMYAAHPVQLLRHLTKWCSQRSEVNVARRQQITPLLERVRLHPDLYHGHECADDHADKQESAFIRSLQTASPASIRLQVRSLWANHEYDLCNSSLHGGGGRQHLSNPDDAAVASNQMEREMQRRHSFANTDCSRRDLASGTSNQTEEKLRGRCNFEHTLRESRDEFDAAQDNVRRCLWRQHVTASSHLSWQPGCAVDLVSLFLASAECGQDALGQEDGTQFAKGSVQAPRRRRSFLHRLLSPLAAGAGYSAECGMTDAHSSTALQPATQTTTDDLDELSVAANAAVAAATTEHEGASIDTHANNEHSCATSMVSNEAVTELEENQSTTDNFHFLQLMLVTMELAREQHERARVEEQLRVQRSRLQEVEYEAANTATMTARLQAAQAEVSKARTEAFELRRSLASMRGTQEKWAAQLQLKIRKFAHDRERASETGSELKVKAIAQEQKICLLQEKLSVLASSEAHQRMIAHDAVSRANAASTDAHTINVLLKQLAHCSELALSRGMALHSLQDVVRNARRGATTATSAVTVSSIRSAESDLHKLRAKMSPLRTKSMTPSQQMDSTVGLSRPHTPSRSPMSSPSPKQSGKSSHYASFPHLSSLVRTNTIIMSWYSPIATGDDSYCRSG